jgi:hypothetical protein
VFGVILHNTYGYSDTYTNAVHVHVGVGLIIVIGIVIAILGLIAMLRAVWQR